MTCRPADRELGRPADCLPLAIKGRGLLPRFFFYQPAIMLNMNKTLKSRLAVFALALIVTQAAVAGEAKPKKAAKAPVKASSNSTALVTWRDLTITDLDFDAAMQIAPKADQAAFRRDMRRISSMLENILVQRTLAAEAKQAGLDKDPQFQQELILASERILARKRIEAFEAGLKVPDLTLAAEEKYKLKPEAYYLPEMVQASHVLVSAEKRSDDEARARAEEVLAKAKAGAEFGLLAREYSDDPSVGTNNGDLGFFGRGKMVKPFEDAVFALEKAGDLSGVVQSPFGYHVIQLTRKRAAHQQPFDEVKPLLLDELQKKWISEQKAAYISDIKNDKSIKLNEEAIGALQVK